MNTGTKLSLVAAAMVLVYMLGTGKLSKFAALLTEKAKPQPQTKR